MPRLRILLVVAACLLLATSAASALTAATAVPHTRAGDSSRSTGANDLKPNECASLSLTGLASGSGSVSGTDANDLVTGSAGVDTLGLGDDCILGGGGADAIDGGPGTDVCIGGPDADTFANCETEVQ